MIPERWQEVERLFHLALERPPLERDAFLDDSCAGDEELRSEVQSLLKNRRPTTIFSNSSIAGVTEPQSRLGHSTWPAAA
jgi:hypothetical protein